MAWLSDTAKNGVSTTITYAAICGWMLQKTRLRPGLSNGTPFTVPTG